MSARAWKPWPNTDSRAALVAALRDGFDLHVVHTEKGNRNFRLSQNGIAAPILHLNQGVAYRAYSAGLFAVGRALEDGSCPLTLKAKRHR